MEEAHRIGQRILDEHTLGIAGHQLPGGGAGIVGQQDRGLLMAQILDEELAVGGQRQLSLPSVLPQQKMLPNG
jgi:hypothetical protein